MNEKLTKKRFYRFLNNAVAYKNYNGFGESAVKGEVDSAEDIWQAIESDREAIRAETREEVLRDHFRPGDRAETLFQGEWVPVTIVGRMPEGRTLSYAPEGSALRRPPKKRPMTDAQMLDSYIAHKENSGCMRESILREVVLSGLTIEALMIGAGLPTEVEE